MTREEALVALRDMLLGMAVVLTLLLPGAWNNPLHRAAWLRLLLLQRRSGLWRQHCRRKAWQRKVAAP